jgi:hypothetical protein
VPKVTLVRSRPVVGDLALLLHQHRRGVGRRQGPECDAGKSLHFDLEAVLLLGFASGCGYRFFATVKPPSAIGVR